MWVLEFEWFYTAKHFSLLGCVALQSTLCDSVTLFFGSSEFPAGARQIEYFTTQYPRLD
jgi:hypothetical protein